MKFLELKATKESIDMKSGGVIVYETDVVTEGPGIILMDNPSGIYSLALISNFHAGGPVKVIMKGVNGVGNKKYCVGDIVAKLAVF